MQICQQIDKLQQAARISSQLHIHEPGYINHSNHTSGNPECLATRDVSAAVTNVLPDMVCQDDLRLVVVDLVLEGLLSQHQVTPLPCPPYVVQPKVACEQSSGLDAKAVCLLVIRPV